MPFARYVKRLVATIRTCAWLSALALLRSTGLLISRWRARLLSAGEAACLMSSSESDWLPRSSESDEPMMSSSESETDDILYIPMPPEDELTVLADDLEQYPEAADCIRVETTRWSPAHLVISRLLAQICLTNQQEAAERLGRNLTLAEFNDNDICRQGVINWRGDAWVPMWPNEDRVYVDADGQRQLKFKGLIKLKPITKCDKRRATQSHSAIHDCSDNE